MVGGDRGSGNQIGGSEPEVLVIGAGLAGTEAAWQVAQAGVRVFDVWHDKQLAAQSAPGDRQAVGQQT